MGKYMVKLRQCQQSMRQFSHPLLDDAPAAPPEDKVEGLLRKAFTGDSDAKQELILNHLSMLRHLIGRYLHHWPITRRFIEEMVSAGLFALTRAVGGLSKSRLKNQTLGQYLLNNMTATIEDEIAKLRGICPAGPSTNRRRILEGDEAVFGEIECDINTSVARSGSHYLEEGFEICDVEDALEFIREEESDPFISSLLDEEFWFLGHTEVANRLDTYPNKIKRGRDMLYQRYLEVTE